jgi:hypothetical protein
MTTLVGFAVLGLSFVLTAQRLQQGRRRTPWLAVVIGIVGSALLLYQ